MSVHAPFFPVWESHTRLAHESSTWWLHLCRALQYACQQMTNASKHSCNRDENFEGNMQMQEPCMGCLWAQSTMLQLTISWLHVMTD